MLDVREQPFVSSFSSTLAVRVRQKSNSTSYCYSKVSGPALLESGPLETNNGSINGEPVERVTGGYGGGGQSGSTHQVQRCTPPLTISAQGRSLLQAHGSPHSAISRMQIGEFGVIGMHNVNYDQWVKT